MRLFRKIYLRVLSGILLFAVTVPGYLLWETEKQSLQDACQYEEERIWNGLSAIQERVQRYGVGLDNDTVRNAVIIKEFRDIFETQGVLFRNGEEVFNISPYDFEQDVMKEMRTKSGLEKRDIFISAPQTADGKKLILFYQENAGFDTAYSFVIYLDVTDIYNRTGNLLLKGLGFTVFLLLVVGIWIYRSIYGVIEPLDALNRAAARIAKGEYGIRIPKRIVAARGKIGRLNMDEIEEVAENFNRMADKVEEHMEKLAEVNEKQRQLLGSLAHEIKTPITAVIGHADMLLTIRLNEDKRTNALLFILNEGKRLSSLSEKMLKLAGLYGEQKAKIEKRETDIGKLFDNLKIQTSVLLKERRVFLRVNIMPGNLKKWMDEDLMLSLLMNLVDNASKASEPGGNIIVSADETGFTVEDFGKGIPKQEINRVTEAFYMVDKSRTGNPGGAGLGLALCQQIVQVHGGKLIIESNLGKGTKVHVNF